MEKLTVPQKLALIRVLMQPRNPQSIQYRMKRHIEIAGNRVLLTHVGVEELNAIIRDLAKSVRLLHPVKTV